jgi:thiol-disulfide isomerase/thioredoxin
VRRSVTLITAGCTAALLAGCSSSSPSAAGTSAAAGADSAASGGATASASAPAPSGGAAADPAALSGSSATTPAGAHPTTASTSHPTARPTAATTHPGPGSVPTSFGYSATADNQALIDAARKAAAADGREVLLDFGASWCGNCVAMDKDFQTSQVKAVLAASYHLVQIDADHDGGTLMRYDSSGSYALPVLIVLSPDGTMRVDTNKSGNPSFGQAGFLAWLKKWAG